MEETLTVHRLGVGELLRCSLATTHPIESCLSTVERAARNVKRWRGGDQPLHWTATGSLEAEKKYRRVKGYLELQRLHRRMNPAMAQQAQVALGSCELPEYRSNTRCGYVFMSPRPFSI